MSRKLCVQKQLRTTSINFIHSQELGCSFLFSKVFSELIVARDPVIYWILKVKSSLIRSKDWILIRWRGNNFYAYFLNLTEKCKKGC